MPRERFCCDNLCSQARQCPARQACELPEPHDALTPGELLSFWAIPGLVVVAIVAAAVVTLW